MQQITIGNTLRKILRLSMLFIFLSSFIVIFIGSADNQINREVRLLSKFLNSAQEVQPNYENSLQIYTESLSSALDYVLALRPDDELEYIAFISAVEDVAQEVGISPELKSVKTDCPTPMSVECETLGYEISFYGSKDQIIEYLHALEKIDYYIRIHEIQYKSLDSLEDDEDKAMPNVSIIVYLYVK